MPDKPKEQPERVDPLDNSNNDPRVQAVRKQQEAEMAEYQKNYKKNVAKKSSDA